MLETHQPARSAVNKQ